MLMIVVGGWEGSVVMETTAGHFTPMKGDMGRRLQFPHIFHAFFVPPPPELPPPPPPPPPPPSANVVVSHATATAVPDAPPAPPPPPPPGPPPDLKKEVKKAKGGTSLADAIKASPIHNMKKKRKSGPKVGKGRGP
jgi:hypothetical protein